MMGSLNFILDSNSQMRSGARPALLKNPGIQRISQGVNAMSPLVGLHLVALDTLDEALAIWANVKVTRSDHAIVNEPNPSMH